MYSGSRLRITALPSPGVFELCFDRVGDAINKFDQKTMEELRAATEWLRAQSDLRGVLVTSAKEVFIVGADISEFPEKFSRSHEVIVEGLWAENEVFVAFEDLPVPTVAAINGFALGGGLEFALTASLRIMSTAAKVGLPEVTLGLMPGFGGTVRLPRVAAPAVACEWIASGRPADAESALQAGVVDAIAAPEALRATALEWLERAITGDLNASARQQRKRLPLPNSATEIDSIFRAAHEKAARKSPPHQPAATLALEMMASAAALNRSGALALEAGAFARVARTQAAVSLVQTFLNDLAVKKQVKRLVKGATPVLQVAVAGTGAMAGSIAFASALKGLPVRVKDVRSDARDLGVVETVEQAAQQAKTAGLADARVASVLEAITAELGNNGFAEVDVVVEALVDDLAVKQRELAELELAAKPGTLIVSNTSSLRVDDLCRSLQRPQDFVVLHFFDPVLAMPLVEVVRGSQSSEAAVARAAAYAAALGKTPIVVKDGAGFLVNRLFVAYLRAFLQLIADGADVITVDEAMEAFGWPTGPAGLADAIGLHIVSEMIEVVSVDYPSRMPLLDDNALRLMVGLGRRGQKSGIGFYRYEPTEQGALGRSVASDTPAVLASLQPGGPRPFAATDIVDRMMLPMVVEAAHALDEGVVASAAELDRAIQLSLGFPAYAGGPMQYADWLGLPEVMARCDRLRALGAAYEPTPRMRRMAANWERFYPRSSSPMPRSASTT